MLINANAKNNDKPGGAVPATCYDASNPKAISILEGDFL
jgi:hypothetical protein